MHVKSVIHSMDPTYGHDKGGTGQREGTHTTTLESQDSFGEWNHDTVPLVRRETILLGDVPLRTAIHTSGHTPTNRERAGHGDLFERTTTGIVLVPTHITSGKDRSTVPGTASPMKTRTRFHIVVHCLIP